MTREKIVTNLRIDRDEWIQLKIMAAEAGLSVNEYITQLIKEQRTKKSFVHIDSDLKKAPKKYSIWRIWEITEGIKEKPMGIKEEDTLIYEL